MSYREEEGGRPGEHGAPADDCLGMGSIDVVDDNLRPDPKAPSFQPDQLDAYEGSGHELIPLHAPGDLDQRGRAVGKAPLHRGWRSAQPLTVAQARDSMDGGRNVGVRLRPCDLVVDVDPRNFAEGDDPVSRLESDLAIDLENFPMVRTGSGGLHVYMRLPEGCSTVETLAAYPGIEFKAHGRQVVAAGSVHPDTGEAYRWEDPVLGVPVGRAPAVPVALLDRLRRPGAPGGIAGGEVSPEQLDTMLEAFEVRDFRDQSAWLELMMACHHATGGDGREEFIAWSVGDPNYADHSSIIGRRWDSLHADEDRPRVTQRTLFKRLIDAGRGELIPSSDAAGDFAGPIDGELDGSRVKREGLADEWVFVIDAELFVRRADSKKWTKEQWRSAFAGSWEGDIVNAAFKGKLPVRKFESLVYLPCRSEFPDGEAGGRYNIWRESGVQAVPGDVSVFLDHMEYLFPDEVERRHVIDYLALLVQNPARKIDFALLVRGDQGTGKSWIGRLMAKIIGSENVVTPSNDEVMSRWTAWTEGSCLAIIEEMMARGRVDMANRLKPIVTDPFLRIEDKNSRIYSIPNHLNLLAFTNHEDALPLEASERRWLVVFSEAHRQDDEYYAKLFAFLEGAGPSAVKHYLLERDVQLNPKSVAPSTIGKRVMRKRSLSDAEQYLDEMLEAREGPFAFDLVRLDDLLSYVPNELKRNVRGLRSKVASWLQVEVKAVKHTRYTKGDNEMRPSCQLWSVRNHAQWGDAGPAERAEAFARWQRGEG